MTVFSLRRTALLVVVIAALLGVLAIPASGADLPSTPVVTQAPPKLPEPRAYWPRHQLVTSTARFVAWTTRGSEMILVRTPHDGGDSKVWRWQAAPPKTASELDRYWGPELAEDGSGGVFITWHTRTTALAHVAVDGRLQFRTTIPADTVPAMVQLEGGDTIVAWADTINGGRTSIVRSARVSSTGAVGRAHIVHRFTAPRSTTTTRRAAATDYLQLARSGSRLYAAWASSVTSTPVSASTRPTTTPPGYLQTSGPHVLRVAQLDVTGTATGSSRSLAGAQGIDVTEGFQLAAGDDGAAHLLWQTRAGDITYVALDGSRLRRAPRVIRRAKSILPPRLVVDGENAAHVILPIDITIDVAAQFRFVHFRIPPVGAVSDGAILGTVTCPEEGFGGIGMVSNSGAFTPLQGSEISCNQYYVVPTVDGVRVAWTYFWKEDAMVVVYRSVTGNVPGPRNTVAGDDLGAIGISATTVWLGRQWSDAVDWSLAKIDF